MASPFAPANIILTGGGAWDALTIDATVNTVLIQACSITWVFAPSATRGLRVIRNRRCEHGRKR